MRIPLRESISLKLFFPPLRMKNKVRGLLTVSVTVASLFACALFARKASMDALRFRSNAFVRVNKSSPELPKASLQPIGRNYLQLPLAFEANQGQTDAQVKFMSRGSGYNLYLTPTEAVLTLRKERGKAKTLENLSVGRDLFDALDQKSPVGKGPAPAEMTAVRM